MDEKQRQSIGIAALVVGLGIFVAGFMAAHFTGLAELDSLGRELYPAIPRGWLWVLGSKVVSLTGGEIVMAAIAFGWLWDRPLTWARAAVAATLLTMQVIIVMAIIPNEWLAITQGEFEWTSQKIAFTVPKWLVLNNHVAVSYGVIKDAVVGGYSATMLAVILITMVKAQDFARKRRGPRATRLSGYGRPLVKGGDNG